MSNDGVELAVSANAKGPPILSPTYYTSSLFVDALRQDILGLCCAFEEQIQSEGQDLPPFSLFKRIWVETSFDILHLKCLDMKSRVEFLRTVHRLFIESIGSSASSARKLASLFGLYTSFFTQPEDVPSPPYILKRVPIPLDEYVSLLALPSNLEGNLGHYAHGVLLKLIQSSAFFILPDSSRAPQNPRVLPHSGVATLVYIRKSGRPTKSHLSNRAKDTLDKVEKWVDAMERPAIDSEEIEIDERRIRNEGLPSSSSSRSQAKADGPTGQSIPSRQGKPKRPQKHLNFDPTTLRNPLHTVPPHSETYIHLKEELQHIVPSDIIQEAEHNIKGNVQDIADIMAQRGIQPSSGSGDGGEDWEGKKLLLEAESLLALFSGK